MALSIMGHTYGNNTATPVSNIDVRLYRKDTGALVDTTTSDVTGKYTFSTADHSPHGLFAMAHSDEYDDAVVDIDKIYHVVTYNITPEIVNAGITLATVDIPDPVKNRLARIEVSTPDPVTGDGSILVVNNFWYDSDWTYRKKITIESAMVTGNSKNFPVLITEANMGVDFFTNLSSATGDDIVFTKNNGLNKLKREIVSLDTNAQTMEAWVKVPQVDSIEDQHIYVYYGNGGASETNDTQTWDSSFAAVYHMHDTDSSTIEDSTVNAKDGTKGTPGEPTEVTGKIGNQQNFDGGDWIEVADESHFDYERTDAFSLECWVTPDLGGIGSVLSKMANAAPFRGYEFVMSSSPRLYLTNDNSPARKIVVQSGVDIRGSQHHFAWAYDGSADESGVTLVLDGVEIALAALANTLNGFTMLNDDPFTIGARASGGSAYEGDIDEVRVSTTARSVNWGINSYNTQNSPSTFYSVGAEETSDVVDEVTLNMLTSSSTTYWSVDTSLTTSVNFYIVSGTPCGLGNASINLFYEFPDLLAPF